MAWTKEQDERHRKEMERLAKEAERRQCTGHPDTCAHCKGR